jgi:hypothetical protein
MPGIAQAGLRTPLSSIVPSLHFSLFGLQCFLYGPSESYIKSANGRLTGSQGNGSVRTFPKKWLGKHVPGATAPQKN